MSKVAFHVVMTVTSAAVVLGWWYVLYRVFVCRCGVW
jgi:hypothetical protein